MRKNILLTILTIITIMLLVSCDSGVIEPDNTMPEQLIIVDNRLSDYTIIRSDIDDSASKAAASLRKQIRDITGCELRITTDWDNNDITDHEIIVGKTTREGEQVESVNRDLLGDEGFTILVSDERIIITGDSALGAENGIAYFIENYVKDSNVSVPKDLNLLVPQVYPVKSLKISGVDISEFIITHTTKASASIAKAAKELQYYIKKACGANLEIKTDYTSNAHVIMLDDTAFDDDESFLIRTDNENLIISGGKARGALYGVYEFLERYVGWRFLTADAEYIIPSDSIDIANANVDYVAIPYLEYRDTYWSAYFDSSIAVKRKVNSSNSRSIPEELGGSIGYTGGFVHTLASLYGCEQSEQPCLSDPEVYDTVLANVFAMLKDNPNARIISVSQNDNYNYCKCADCAAVDDEEGSHAGTIIRFVNRIADAVAVDYPKVEIHTLAYQYSRQAPIVTKPRDNVIIQLCTIECCFNHSIDDPDCSTNVAMNNDIEAWSKICNRIYIWDYTTNFAYYIAPFPNFDILAANVKFFHQNNVKGVFEQGNYQGPSGEFGELRAYLLSKLLWNPYMTEDEYYTCMDEFLRGYYGNGWEYIRKYINFMLESGNKQGHFGIYAAPEDMVKISDYYSRYEEIDGWFDTAESMAETELQLSHIKRSRLQFTYMKLNIIFDGIYYGTDEVSKTALIEQLQQFHDEMVAFDIRISEGRGVPSESDMVSAPKHW